MEEPNTLEDEHQGILVPGTRLGKYQIVRLLGAGGMGAVYEAIHTEIGKQVAVKILSPEIAAIPGARGRFLREAQLTSRVRHPNIVDVTDMGSESGQTFLVMEFFRGEDLAQRLAREGRLTPQETADIMLPVCSAVVAAHQAGVTHRDLKPSNIFLAEAQRAIEPKILDFGISKSMDVGLSGDALTGTGAVVGTPFYLAPEQIMDNRAAGPASDQYALGVILYECLTGVRPFQGESLYPVFKEIVTGAAMPPRAHYPDIPPSLEQVVLRAMHVNPLGRYDSTKDLGRALLLFASERVRSIWQEGFLSEGPGPDDFVDVSFDEPRPPRAVAVTRVLTPSANPAGSVPVGLAGGTLFAAPASSPQPSGSPGGNPPRNRPRVAGPATDPFPDIDVADVFEPERPRSRLPVVLATLGGLALAGVVAWFVLDGPPTDARQSGTGKKPRRALTTEPAAPNPSLPRELDSPGPADPRPPDAFELSISIEPDTALIELDGRPMGKGHLERSLPVDHTPHRLRLVADGYESQTVDFTDVPPPGRITLAPAPGQRAGQIGGEHSEVRFQRRRHHRVELLRASPQTPERTSHTPSVPPNGAPIIE